MRDSNNPFAARPRNQRNVKMKIRGVELGGRPRVAAVITGKIDPNTIKKAARDGADLIEVRVDTFGDKELGRISESFGALASLASDSPLPVILTIRSSREGGEREMTDSARLALFTSLIPFADIVDIELSSARILDRVVAIARRHRKMVLVSHHDFSKTPTAARLSDIAARSRAAGADIVKIAATAKKAADLKRLAALVAGSSDMIVIAMGAGGAVSRVFFPFIGSMVTYASIGKSTAPGQMGLAELRAAIDRYA